MHGSAQEVIQAPVTTSGTPKSATIPLNNPAWARLISAFMVIATDATAGQRSFNVELLDSSGNVLFRIFNAQMNPSLTWNVQFGLSPNPGTNTSLGQELPELVMLPPNSVVKITDINNRQSTGDSVSMNTVLLY